MKSKLYKRTNRSLYFNVDKEFRSMLNVVTNDIIFLHLVISKENKLSLILSKEKDLDDFNIVYSKSEKLIRNSVKSKQNRIALNSTLCDLVVLDYSEVFLNPLFLGDNVIFECIFK